MFTLNMQSHLGFNITGGLSQVFNLLSMEDPHLVLTGHTTIEHFSQEEELLKFISLTQQDLEFNSMVQLNIHHQTYQSIVLHANLLMDVLDKESAIAPITSSFNDLKIFKRFVFYLILKGNI